MNILFKKLNSFVNNCVQVLLDNKKISNFSFIESGMHSLGYEFLDEVFFDVYEIKGSGFDLIKEKKGDANGIPIVELDLSIDNEIYKNVKFSLKEGKNILINPNLLDFTKTVITETVKTPTKVVKKSKKSKKIIEEEVLVKNTESIVEKHKQEFADSIKNEILEHLKQEIKLGIISDLLKENVKSNFDTVLKEDVYRSKLQKLFQNENNKFRKELIEVAEKVSRREAIRYSEGGGGTNAAQYANGGTIDGDLVITKTLTVDTLTANTITGLSITGGVSKVKMHIVGDGHTNQFILNHNAGTKDIGVSVYNSNTNELVIVYIQNIDNNNTLIDFHNPLNTGELYHAIIFY